jgi:transcriptional regulator GlxA family with amidase domain
MESTWRLARRNPRRPRLLLVERDLGRRATLAVAVGTRYLVETAATAPDALAHAAMTRFDLAVLDAGALGAALPSLVRALRRGGRAITIVVVATRRDFRAHHFAAMLHVDAVLGRRAPAYTVLERISALAPAGEPRAIVDRRVGHAIDLMARDVIHLLDVDALAHATGLARPALADRFRLATDLTVDEYVTCVRVAVAEQLLRDTTLEMETLAELLGFGTVHELARAFAALSPA